jgi:glutamyl/glutaminyl-tRNA synthetase
LHLAYEYNIVFELKSLLGILNLIKKINDIEKKGMLSSNIINMLMNKIKIPNLSNLLNEKIAKIQPNSENKSYIKFSSEELNLNNSHFIFINKDIAYLLNEKNVLYKFYKTVDNKNKYNIIEINNNIINNEQISLISLEKEYLFGFDSKEFGKGENVIKLLKKEHNSSLNKIQIKMDEISQKILTKSIINSNEVINDIYLNLFDFESNEKDKFLTK